MVYRQSTFNTIPGVRLAMRKSASSSLFGPQKMDITQPLSRASSVAAELAIQKQQAQYQKRYFSSYYYKFPKIPRPKRNALYYSTWSNAASKKNIRFPKLKLPTRQLSNANQKLRNKTKNIRNRFFSVEARKQRQQRRRFIRWWTITSLAVVLGGVAARIRYDKNEDIPKNPYQIKPQSWHLYAYSTLPLKSISRLWGTVNSINLPIWLRSPTYRIYSTFFGVNLDEMDEPDLSTYTNLSNFFYRKLKPGVRPLGDSELVSPSDGKVLKFGIVENGEIEQVKGMTYSIDALLGLNTQKLAAPSQLLDFTHESSEESDILHREFAKINGISYTLEDIIGGQNDDTFHLNELEYKDDGDKTAASATVAKELAVAKNLTPTSVQDLSTLGSSQKQLFFAVIYLAPGDYHRYHSPTNWVTTLRRHFIGELFSVAPFFQKTLQGLFVLNERVALLGYWKHGFFSMIPVGATNVGSIVVNFDKDLKTNARYEHDSYSKASSESSSTFASSSTSSVNESTPLLPEETASDAAYARVEKKRLKKNTVYEATYSKASSLLGGYPLTKGQEVGGFKLGSTVVLVFEAPNNFKFDLTLGQKIKMGQSLGAFV